MFRLQWLPINYWITATKVRHRSRIQFIVCGSMSAQLFMLLQLQLLLSEGSSWILGDQHSPGKVEEWRVSVHPNPGTTPNCGSLWRRRRRRGEFVSPEQERMQESMKKYTKRNGLIFSNAMAVRQCPFCKSKWTTITIKHQQRTNELTDQ